MQFNWRKTVVWILLLLTLPSMLHAIIIYNDGACSIRVKYRLRYHPVNESTCARQSGAFTYSPSATTWYSAVLTSGQNFYIGLCTHPTCSCANGKQGDAVILGPVTLETNSATIWTGNVSLPLSHVATNSQIHFDCNGFSYATSPEVEDDNDFWEDILDYSDNDTDKGDPDGLDCGNTPIGKLVVNGMPRWRVSEPYISLWLHDEPLGYQPAIGSRISFLMSYKQRETVAGFDTNIFSLGKSWNSTWLSFVTQNSAGNRVVYFPGGGRSIIQEWADYKTHTQISGATNTGFNLIFADGRTNVYGFLVTNASGAFLKAFLSESRNEIGQKTTYLYESYAPANPIIRLKYVVDGDGRTNTISYSTNNAYSTNLISQVTDPFGRTASMQYDSNGLLTNVIDVAQLASQFRYDSNGWATHLITPYGTTSFDYTDASSSNSVPNGRSVLVTLPDGGQHLYLYTNSAPGISASYATNEVPTTGTFANTLDNTELHLRNTFHWGQRQYTALSTTNIGAFTADDFRKARMKHWLKVGINGTSDTLSMMRLPSADGTSEGQKLWYDHADKDTNNTIGLQPEPLFTAILLPDGTSSFIRTERNALGYITRDVKSYTANSAIAFRTNSYTYAANLIDLLRVTNAIGVRVVSNAYNGFHQVTNSYNALNERTIFTYDSNRRLSRIIHPTGLTVSNVYGADGFVAQIIATGISTNSFTYSNNLIHTHTDARGLTVTNTWDSLQRLTRVGFPDGTFITNAYDKLDLVRTVDRMGFTNSFGYNAVQQMTATTNASGHYTLYDYCSCGVLNSVRDAENHDTYFFYDHAGRLTNTVAADGYAVTNHYNLLGQLINIVDSAGTSVTNWFNNQGLLFTSSNAFGRLNLAIFDALDRVTNSVDANGVTLTNTYDNLNRLLTRGYPDGGVERWRYTTNYAAATSYTNQLGTNVVNYTYDLLNRKTNEVYPNISTNRFTYGPASDLLTLTDGKNQITTWKYDEYGRTTNKVDATSTEIFRFSYDPNGRLTNRWTAAKGNTAYSFDVVGNLKTITYPVSPAVSFAYDALNRLTNMVDGVGTNVYTYNAVSQLLTEDGPWASDTLTYTYNSRLRQSLSLQQPTGTWTNGYTYDGMKRLTNVTSPAGAFSYLYPSSPSPLVSRLSLPGGAYITNTYDTVTRLLSTKLLTSSASVLNAHSYGYNVAGQRTVLTNTAGDYRNYTYDNVGQLKTVLGYETNAAPRLNEQLGYTYDPAGNLNFRTNNNFVQAFSNNLLNELTMATCSGTYTVAGNTATAATNVTVNTSNALLYADYTYASTNHTLANGNNTFTAIAKEVAGFSDTNTVIAYLPATNVFAYDLNGNLITNGNQVLDYDDENRLVTNYVAGSWKSEFVYDGAHRRRIQRDYEWTGSAWTKTNEVRLLYDGKLILQHRDGNNTPALTLTRGLDLSGSFQGAGGIGGLLAITDASGTSSFYHGDGGGNVTALINTNQLIVGKYLFDSFGNTLAVSGPKALLNPYRFSSKPIHEASGSYDYLHRWYAPAVQRWLTRDPLSEIGGLNLYVSFANSPTLFIDAWGLQINFGTFVDSAPKYSDGHDVQSGLINIGFLLGSMDSTRETILQVVGSTPDSYDSKIRSDIFAPTWNQGVSVGETFWGLSFGTPFGGAGPAQSFCGAAPNAISYFDKAIELGNGAVDLVKTTYQETKGYIEDLLGIKSPPPTPVIIIEYGPDYKGRRL